MKIKIAILGMIFTMASFADFKEMSERLIRTRQEIEILNTDLDSLQKKQSSQWETLLSRKAELETQLKKERFKSLQLYEKKMTLKQRIAPQKGLTPKEKKVVTSWHKDLLQWVNQTLPYKNEERIAELKKIEDGIKNNSSFHEIVGKLWKFSEKEIELVRHNKYEVLSLDIKGKKTTAEVARVGLLTFAFKLPSDEFGFAKKSSGKWILSVSQEKKELTAAKRLIAKFKEKKYSGLFDIPTAEL